MANLFSNVENGPGSASEITVSTYGELVSRFTQGEIPIGLVPHLLINCLGYAPETIGAFIPDFEVYQRHFSDFGRPTIQDPSHILGGEW